MDTDPVSMDAGRFHFVAATYDGFKLRVYLDDTLIGAAPFVGSIVQGNRPAYIGMAPFNISSSPFKTRTSKAVIDEVELFDRALSKRELHAIFVAGPCGKCKAGLVTSLDRAPSEPLAPRHPKSPGSPASADCP